MSDNRALELADGLERLASGAVECEADERFLCEAAALLRSQAADAARAWEAANSADTLRDRAVADADALAGALRALYQRRPYGTWSECVCCGETWWPNEIEAMRHKSDCYAYRALARHDGGARP